MPVWNWTEKDRKALGSGVISYKTQEDWEEYLSVEGAYLIDCDDFRVLGLTPFVNETLRFLTGRFCKELLLWQTDHLSEQQLFFLLLNQIRSLALPWPWHNTKEKR